MTDMTWRERLEWLAEKHITREYRTTTFGEHDARQMLAALDTLSPLVLTRLKLQDAAMDGANTQVQP